MSDGEGKKKRGRPRTMDPEHVLKVAMDSYWREDPADVSVNAICRRAGVSKPSVYREFRSEDGLTRAVLERYAREVLEDIREVIEAGAGLRATLEALTEFACDDPRMETGCLFYKMRHGKHRLGPETRALVDELDAGVQQTYATFIKARREGGEWPLDITVEAGARYLAQQVALAISQRASGEGREEIRESLSLALSVLLR